MKSRKWKIIDRIGWFVQGMITGLILDIPMAFILVGVSQTFWPNNNIGWLVWWTLILFPISGGWSVMNDGILEERKKERRARTN